MKNKVISNKANKCRLKQIRDSNKREVNLNYEDNERKLHLKSTPDLRDNTNYNNNKSNNISGLKTNKQRSQSDPRPVISRPIPAESSQFNKPTQDLTSLQFVNNIGPHKTNRQTLSPLLTSQVPQIKLSNLRPVSVTGNEEVGIWTEKPVESVQPGSKTIINQLMECDLNSIENCSICHKIMPVNERYDLVDQVIHRNCFKCSLCNETLTDKSAIFQNDHSLTSTTILAQKQEIDEKSENGNKDTKKSDLERRISNASGGRMGNIRNKFESGEVNSDKRKNKKKSAPKMKYAGVESVKTRFIEEATKATMSKVEDGPRKPKEFTPPPDGVAVGILESNPKPRAPDVVTSDDMFEPVDLKEITTGGQSIDGENRKKSSFIDESITVAPEATKNARARWKDIESGKTEKDALSERPKLDIHDGYGGVYENEPEKFENIARAERRELFLKKAADTSVVKRDSIKLIDINAAESGIYENEPTRLDNVVRYDDDQTDDYPSNSVKWASEAKNRFIQEASKSQITTGSNKTILLVEDGHTNGNGDGAPKQARYTTQAKQAFLERQKQAEEAAKNKSRPDIIDIWQEQCPHSGVFENVPAAHTADVVVTDESEEDDEEEEEEQ
ncbi:unnamed protein product [Schistosoma mattheei]|uniref:LIM zinc-binding domain-containing protein n=1 Tax=Schistosoma mattheei TaxID=31246 RepID=A0AA85B8P6_9TREM|nr:unnamed protein product [Schistosoma mattheei]